MLFISKLRQRHLILGIFYEQDLLFLVETIKLVFMSYNEV